jgi:hypothetical protein
MPRSQLPLSLRDSLAPNSVPRRCKHSIYSWPIRWYSGSEKLSRVSIKRSTILAIVYTECGKDEPLDRSNLERGEDTYVVHFAQDVVRKGWDHKENPTSLS